MAKQLNPGDAFPNYTVPITLVRAVDTVNQLKISEEDKQKVLGGNAAKLLNLAG
jgi:predicted TIM-barrel fold metal-dependent hydrolase